MNKTTNNYEGQIHMLVTVGNTRPEKQYNNTLWSISQWMNDCGAKVRLRDAILMSLFNAESAFI